MANRDLTYWDAMDRGAMSEDIIHASTALSPEYAKYIYNVTPCNTVISSKGIRNPGMGAMGAITSTSTLSPFPDKGYNVGIGTTLCFKTGNQVATGFKCNRRSLGAIFFMANMHRHLFRCVHPIYSATVTNAVYSGTFRFRFDRKKICNLVRSRPNAQFVGVTLRTNHTTDADKTTHTIMIFKSGKANFPGAKTITQVEETLHYNLFDLLQCVEDTPTVPTKETRPHTTTRKTHRNTLVNSLAQAKAQKRLANTGPGWHSFYNGRVTPYGR
jgi:TATA-box binding protein (TBP) (component of TFIID and TFIIIB)